MDLWQLEIFCKVIELRSFSKAGSAVHLSQPTVSSHIKDLEHHFSCKLLDRLSKEAIPTETGKLLYQYALKLISLKEEAEAAVAEFQGKIQGRLPIGGSTIPGGYLLPRIVGEFSNRYPDVRICLTIGDSEKIIDDTLHGRVVFGVVGARTNDRRIIQQKAFQENLRLIVPAGHRWSGRSSVALEMLLEEPFIAREKGSGTLAALLHSLETKGFSLKNFHIVAEMGSTEAVIQAIKCGVGVSILSPVAAADEIGAGRLEAIAVKGLDLKRSFYLSRHRYRSPSPAGRVFADFLLAKLRSIEGEAKASDGIALDGGDQAGPVPESCPGIAR